MLHLETVKNIIEYLNKDEVYNRLGNKINNDIVLRTFADYDEVNCIFDNDSFVIEYDKNLEEFVLSTSFSNQVVNSLFMNTINILVNKVNVINEMLYK